VGEGEQAGSRGMSISGKVSVKGADFSILKMEAMRSSETSVNPVSTTQRNIPEDGILHSLRYENLKFYYIHLFKVLLAKVSLRILN
jgi:hypothetical protein